MRLEVDKYCIYSSLIPTSWYFGIAENSRVGDMVLSKMVISRYIFKIWRSAYNGYLYLSFFLAGYVKSGWSFKIGDRGDRKADLI